MKLDLTDEQALAWSEEKYRQDGFMTFACRFPKEIGEQLNVQDSYLRHLSWRVIGPSSPEELKTQLPEWMATPIGFSYYYRAEVMD